MIRVILVEDEPSAMRHLSMIIEQKCIGFKIVATAENGAEALKKIRILKPDIIITDIKMPEIDGINLVSCVKSEMPFIYSVITSGYQDFEYAKGAIKSGVIDYLLKPVNPVQLSELLYQIKDRIEEQYRVERTTILKQSIAGTNIERWRMMRCMPFNCFHAAVFRRNGLPSRFSAAQRSTAFKFDADMIPLFETVGDEKTWNVPGRDEMEVVILHALEIPGEDPFKTKVLKAAGDIKGGYYNIAFSSCFSSLQDLRKTILLLYRIIDNRSVIGVSQVFHENVPYKAKDSAVNFDSSFLNKMGFHLSNGQYRDLKEEIIRLFITWEKDNLTQLCVESILRQILQYVYKYSTKQFMQWQDVEFLLDEALYYSNSFGELMSNTWDIIDKLLDKSEIRGHKVNNPEFFASVGQYVEKNICEPLTLQSVCSTFGISQTYLSRLFRKYKNMSFNEYLTLCRVDKAKDLIARHPDMHLKDIACSVGYNDQFYFSRVFRMITGIPPSEFLSGLKS